MFAVVPVYRLDALRWVYYTIPGICDYPGDLVITAKVPHREVYQFHIDLEGCLENPGVLCTGAFWEIPTDWLTSSIPTTPGNISIPDLMNIAGNELVFPASQSQHSVIEIDLIHQQKSIIERDIDVCYNTDVTSMKLIAIIYELVVVWSFAMIDMMDPRMFCRFGFAN